MLKTKNLIILAALLVVLAGINFMQKSSHQKSTSGSSAETVIPGTFAKENLGKITLGFGPDSEQVVLVSSPGGWLVETAFNYPANEERIDTLLRNFSSLTGEFRSDNESVLDQYGLDQGQSIKVRAYDKQGNEAMAVDVGKTPERFPGHFVRLPDQNKVYLSQKGLLSHLGVYGPPAAPESKHFLDLQVLQEDRLEVDRIVVIDGDTKLDLVKKFAVEPVAEDAPEGSEPTVDRMTWEWQRAGSNLALAKTKVDALLGAVVNIRATDVADPGAPPSDYGLGSPVRQVTLHLQGGTTRVLEFGAERPAEGSRQAGTYFRSEGQDGVWLVSDYTTRNIFKTIEELQP